MALTYIDIVVLVAVGFGFIRGWTNGIIKEVAGMVGVILGLWAGLRLAWIFADYYRENFEVPEAVIPLIAFLSAFLLVLVGVILIGRLLKKILEKASLSGFDKIAGALFGGLKLAFIVGTLVGLVGKSGFLPSETKEKSVTYPYLIVFTEAVTDYSIGLIPAAKNTFGEMDEYFDGLRGDKSGSAGELGEQETTTDPESDPQPTPEENQP